MNRMSCVLFISSTQSYCRRKLLLDLTFTLLRRLVQLSIIVLYCPVDCKFSEKSLFFSYFINYNSILIYLHTKDK